MDLKAFSYCCLLLAHLCPGLHPGLQGSQTCFCYRPNTNPIYFQTRTINSLHETRLLCTSLFYRWQPSGDLSNEKGLPVLCFPSPLVSNMMPFTGNRVLYSTVSNRWLETLYLSGRGNVMMPSHVINHFPAFCMNRNKWAENGGQLEREELLHWKENYTDCSFFFPWGSLEAPLKS